MIVKGSEGIRHVAMHVRDGLLPSASDPYIASEMRFTAMCLELIAEDFDRAVDVLISDRDDMQAIFTAASGSVDDPLQARIAARLQARPADYRVQTLSQLVDDDMAVLIALQAFCEDGEGSSGTQALVDQIWAFLGRYAERRRYRSPI